ncbi:hypothetical protein AVEN_132150-1 [Araneus ventricosus]|uniref:Uncharacterized protein n=1 Tax=Araneus ventricosus TaxID=182803 RepID=A0A4Y2WSW4_ARAVE|nr:hypothetical protein AVEN_132150-1 [Araneus ventricosus]
MNYSDQPRNAGNLNDQAAATINQALRPSHNSPYYERLMRRPLRQRYDLSSAEDNLNEQAVATINQALWPSHNITSGSCDDSSDRYDLSSVEDNLNEQAAATINQALWPSHNSPYYERLMRRPLRRRYDLSSVEDNLNDTHHYYIPSGNETLLTYKAGSHPNI